MRDPDRLVYFRERGRRRPGHGRLRAQPGPVARRRRPSRPTSTTGSCPRTGSGSSRSPRTRSALVPALADRRGRDRSINGPEAFTPDGEFILGETEVRGFFVAAGFCAHGIAGAGGVGKVMADWIVRRRARDATCGRWTSAGSARTTARATTRRERAYEIYAKHYDIHYPGEEWQAGRPLKTAPTYARLAALGAAFGEKAGWERANWFASNEDPAFEELRPRGWAGEHWSTRDRGRAHRPRASARRLFDESSFAKIEVSGPGAMRVPPASARTTSTPARAPSIYTQMLNRRGGIECDLTVTRLDDDRFRARDRHGVRQPRPRVDPQAARHERTSAVDGPRRDSAPWAASACGVRARGTSCRRVTADDLSNEAFPYMTARADHGGRRAVPRAAGDLRRRARVGAVSARRSSPERSGTRCSRPASRSG